MSIKYLFRLFLIALPVLVMAGCAQTKVRETEEIAYTGLPSPKQVLVYNFAVNPQDVSQNSSIFAKLQRNISRVDQTQDELQIGRETADALADELVQKLLGMGMNPMRADQNMPVSPGTILITGQFIKIDEGNRLRRNVIGFGLGQSSLDCDVNVLAPSGTDYRKLIAFSAHADSGEMPGAAVMGPAGAAAGAGTAAVLATNAAVGGIKSYRSASAQQAEKIAEKIAEQLANYFTQQGWTRPGIKP